jgi:putative ABC transport system permease protein
MIFRGVSTRCRLLGVVKDFNYESLHNKIKPFGFATSFFANKYSYVIVNLNTADYSKILSRVDKIWGSVNPGIPFNYSFLDQDFQKNYVNDQRTSKIVIYFTFVAIVIACLGLFGLAAFSAEQRIKEIGIRKVLGATIPGITLLISKDFLKLVIVSLVIATPVALWGMNKWLQNFAYRIQMEWWMFAIAGVLAMLIALVTVSFQALRAAIANPVKSLRSE